MSMVSEDPTSRVIVLPVRVFTKILHTAEVPRGTIYRLLLPLPRLLLLLYYLLLLSSADPGRSSSSSPSMIKLSTSSSTTTSSSSSSRAPSRSSS